MQVLYNAADMMTVGQFCGINALAAVGATTNAYNLYFKKVKQKAAQKTAEA